MFQKNMAVSVWGEEMTIWGWSFRKLLLNKLNVILKIILFLKWFPEYLFNPGQKFVDKILINGNSKSSSVIILCIIF